MHSNSCDYLCKISAAPLHWIYDQGKVKSLTEAEKTVEFYPKPECPFYTIPVGSNSAYGDQVYVTLKNVAESKGMISLQVILLL